jgi:hypothetical protein
MKRPSTGHAFARRVGGAVLLVIVLAPCTARAQAWLPAKGSFGFAFDYADVLNKKHYTSVGDEVDVGHTDVQIYNFSASYSPSDRIALSASLPFVRTRHRGPNGGGHDTEIDNGSWHDTVTDLQLMATFQAAGGPIALAPYVGLLIPTRSYTTFGHAAPGRGLEELWLGFYAGASLHPWVPRTYVQLRGNYAFVEEVAGVSHDRTNATLEIGYYLNPSWSVRALVSSQWTHGGIDVPVLPDDPRFPVLFPVHDRLAAEEFVSIGAGGTWAINERLSAYGLYLQAIEGTNAHKVDHRISIGVSYGVGAH